nr:interleukin-12 receptor subunit beta-1 [Pandoravirus belohorizontensis]
MREQAEIEFRQRRPRTNWVLGSRHKNHKESPETITRCVQQTCLFVFFLSLRSKKKAEPPKKKEKMVACRRCHAFFFFFYFMQMENFEFKKARLLSVLAVAGCVPFFLK